MKIHNYSDFWNLRYRQLAEYLSQIKINSFNHSVSKDETQQFNKGSNEIFVDQRGVVLAGRFFANSGGN